MCKHLEDICNSSCHCQNVIEILHWKWSKRWWMVTRKSIWGLFKCYGPALDWTALSISAPSWQTHTKALTGHRDKIQHELPSAEHCSVIFPRTAWVKVTWPFFSFFFLKSCLLAAILDLVQLNTGPYRTGLHAQLGFFFFFFVPWASRTGIVMFQFAKIIWVSSIHRAAIYKPCTSPKGSYAVLTRTFTNMSNTFLFPLCNQSETLQCTRSNLIL